MYAKFLLCITHSIQYKVKKLLCMPKKLKCDIGANKALDINIQMTQILQLAEKHFIAANIKRSMI